MKCEGSTSIDAESRGIEAALDRAFERAMELGRRTGTPVWIVRDGELVNALAHEQEGAERNGESPSN